ncbi:hypothetical protein QQF64_008424, partial [Cirrhinus molitorella]
MIPPDPSAHLRMNDSRAGRLDSLTNDLSAQSVSVFNGLIHVLFQQRDNLDPVATSVWIISRRDLKDHFQRSPIITAKALGRSLWDSLPLCSEPGVRRQMEVTNLDPDPRAEGSEGEGSCVPISPGTEPVVLEYPVEYDPYGEKMPFHHVTAGLLYKGNYLSRSLSEHSNSEQLASISVEELDEIREAFRVLDRDGNGFISKQELGMAMRSLGYMPSEVELAIIMQRLDMDGDGQVDFEEFMTILGPKLLSSETREGFLGNTIDSIFWQFDMQRITLEELKHILFHAFRDHLTMKDIENIIINEEESLNENSGNCQTEFEG